MDEHSEYNNNTSDVDNTLENDNLNERLIEAYKAVLTFVGMVDQTLYEEYNSIPMNEQDCIHKMNELYLRLVEQLSIEKEELEKFRKLYGDLNEYKIMKERDTDMEEKKVRQEIEELNKHANDLRESINQTNLDIVQDNPVSLQIQNSEDQTQNNKDSNNKKRRSIHQDEANKLIDANDQIYSSDNACDPEILREKEILEDLKEEMHILKANIHDLNELSFKLQDQIQSIEQEGSEVENDCNELVIKKDNIEEALLNKEAIQQEISFVEKMKQEELEVKKENLFICEDNYDEVKRKDQAISKNILHLMKKSEGITDRYYNILRIKDELEQEVRETDEIMNNLRDENKFLGSEVSQLQRIEFEIEDQIILNRQLNEKYEVFKDKFLRKKKADQEAIANSNNNQDNIGTQAENLENDDTANQQDLNIRVNNNSQNILSCLEYPQLKLDESFKIKIELEDFGKKPENYERQLGNQETNSNVTSNKSSRMMTSKFKSIDNIKNAQYTQEVTSEEDGLVKINFGKNETSINANNKEILQFYQHSDTKLQSETFNPRIVTSEHGSIYYSSNVDNEKNVRSSKTPISGKRSNASKLKKSGLMRKTNNSQSFGSASKFGSADNYKDSAVNDVMRNMIMENSLQIERLEKLSAELSGAIQTETYNQETILLNVSPKITITNQQQNNCSDDFSSNKQSDAYNNQYNVKDNAQLRFNSLSDGISNSIKSPDNIESYKLNSGLYIDYDNKSTPTNNYSTRANFQKDDYAKNYETNLLTTLNSNNANKDSIISDKNNSYQKALNSSEAKNVPDPVINQMERRQKELLKSCNLSNNEKYKSQFESQNYDSNYASADNFEFRNSDTTGLQIKSKEMNDQLSPESNLPKSDYYKSDSNSEGKSLHNHRESNLIPQKVDYLNQVAFEPMTVNLNLASNAINNQNKSKQIQDNSIPLKTLQ